MTSSIWGCVLKGCFERGICWNIISRLKGLEDFNLEHCSKPNLILWELSGPLDILQYAWLHGNLLLHKCAPYTYLSWVRDRLKKLTVGSGVLKPRCQDRLQIIKFSMAHMVSSAGFECMDRKN